MAPSTNLPANVQSELNRRHKTTSTTVLSLLVAVVLLCVLAFVSQKFLTPRANPTLQWPVLITILVLGLGAFPFRRTRFATMRLQDIAGLRGITGLLAFLQKTTLQIALIGTLAALVGFAATLLMGDSTYTYRAGVVAALVLLYCYPVRSSWEQAVRRFSPDGETDSSEISV